MMAFASSAQLSPNKTNKEHCHFDESMIFLIMLQVAAFPKRIPGNYISPISSL